MDSTFAHRGFLPDEDPVTRFPPDSELAQLDEIGRDLPSLLQDPAFRRYATGLRIPPWPERPAFPDSERLLRLYYVRLGFLASGYVNQVSQPPASRVPANLAVPLCRACALLERPPVLSYDGYALYNWKRFDPAGSIALGNIDTIQNFVHLYDEHWFILVHVEIEAIAAGILAAIDSAARAQASGDVAGVERALREIAAAVWRQVGVLRRIPEKMDPSLYYRTFRPYIRFFENVVYEGVSEQPMDFRGETGAQSSIMPALIAFMKIRHEPSALTDHLADMRRFMPAAHRRLLTEIEALPPVHGSVDPAAYDDVLDAIAAFREVHLGWARQYVDRWVDDPRGTGGTPFMRWLSQLVEETLRARRTGH